jgi:hypothetical protein
MIAEDLTITKHDEALVVRQRSRHLVLVSVTVGQALHLRRSRFIEFEREQELVQQILWCEGADGRPS